MKPLLALEDAQRRLLDLAPCLPVTHVALEDAIGRFLAKPLKALRTHPFADMSAMDGYAIADGDLAGPWRIIGESAAGHPFCGSIDRGQTARISTGAVMPDGTSYVVLQEDVEVSGDMVSFTGSPTFPPYKHVRHRGMDFAEGMIVLDEGAYVGPPQMGLAMSAGHKDLPVRGCLRVAIIDSGDELASEVDPMAHARIPPSNGLMLENMVRSSGASVTRAGPVADRLDALVAAFDACASADIVVTSGGASVGDHDLIRPALAAWGAEIDFWRVAIKPGKPILVATRKHAGKRQLVLGLPGNPVSCFVTAYLFLLPLLRQMMGAERPLPVAISTVCDAELPATGHRREFLRGVWNGRTVTPVALQDSGALSSLSASNVLIDRPANSPATARGARVEVFTLQNGGIL